METLVMQVVLWALMIVLLFILRNACKRLARVIHQQRAQPAQRPHAAPPAHAAPARFDHADQVLEMIGHYQDCEIYRYAIIDGVPCRFDRVSPAVHPFRLDPNEHCLAPGLVYVRDPSLSRDTLFTA